MIIESYEKLEKERKFLIEVPLSWVGKFKAITAKKVKIYQTYLKEGNFNSRVRISFEKGKAYQKSIHTYTKKEHISPGINKEYEDIITQEGYREKLKYQDHTRHRIEKTRYFIDFDNRMFELDVFEDKLIGLAILEIELDSLEEEIITPPYLKVLKEITKNNSYSNRNLATIKYYKFSDLHSRQHSA